MPCVCTNKRSIIMKTMRITSIASHPVYGTFSAVTVDGQPVCVALEPYGRDNKQNISSINPGQYLCKRYSSARYPSTFEITNVAGRSKVLFHVGNWSHDTEGCILLGESFSILNGKWAIGMSGKAFSEFMGLMYGVDEFLLTVVREY